MKNPFAQKANEPRVIHSNSREGGAYEADLATRLFNLKNISGFNKRIREALRLHLANRKTQTPRMDCRQARRNP